MGQQHFLIISAVLATSTKMADAAFIGLLQVFRHIERHDWQVVRHALTTLPLEPIGTTSPAEAEAEAEAYISLPSPLNVAILFKGNSIWQNKRR